MFLFLGQSDNVFYQYQLQQMYFFNRSLYNDYNHMYMYWYITLHELHCIIVFVATHI